MESENKIQSKNGVLAWARSCFLTGLFAVTPIFLTFYIIRFTVNLLNNTAESIFPEKYAPSYFLPFDIPGFELFLGIVLLFLIGIIVKHYAGEKLLKWAENVVKGIPGVGTVYGTIKQVLDTVATSNSNSFREVVLVEYPRRGSWALGFITGEAKGEIQRIEDEEIVNVFVPTTPNPTSGFLLFLPKKDTRSMHMTVDQGLKMIFSAGIVAPTEEEGEKALRAERKAQKESEKQDKDEI